MTRETFHTLQLIMLMSLSGFVGSYILEQVITGGHDTSPSSTSRTSTAGTTSCGWTTPTVNCNDILQLMRRTLEPNEEAMSRSYIIEKWESARNMYVDML